MVDWQKVVWGSLGPEMVDRLKLAPRKAVP